MRLSVRALVGIADGEREVIRSVIWIEVKHFDEGSNRLCFTFILLLFQTEGVPRFVICRIALYGSFEL